LTAESEFIFKSKSLGNLVVRLTDVNVTPRQDTGCLVYDCSFTATEVADINTHKLQNIVLSEFHPIEITLPSEDVMTAWS
jgi:hypothetical protein